MNCYKIEGGQKLCGKVTVHGSKNAALPILAASIINGGINLIHNCPFLSDVDSIIEILEFLGCRVCRNARDVTVDSSSFKLRDIPSGAMCCTRASTLFAGALLARCGRAFIAGSGGCSIGKRPIDMHLKAFKTMGYSIFFADGGVLCTGKQKNDAKVILDFPSVGATENIMLAASSYKGTTHICNAAREPEIQNLADFLRSIGCMISGDGTGEIYITGTESPTDSHIDIIPDRIVAATYASAVACAGGKIEICGIKPSLVYPFCDILGDIGISVCQRPDGFTVEKIRRCKCIGKLSTAPYPGFPTDCQPLIVASLATADGVSVVEETVFENRFGHCNRLVLMGADIRISGSEATIRGVKRLHGAHTDACDLRCGAALAVAALGADGYTYLGKTEYIERGYENLLADLKTLGAAIERID